VVKLAEPDGLIGKVASVVIPSWKAIEPVGVPEPGETTEMLAEMVTDWFKRSGLAEALRVVVVEARLTVYVKAGEVLPKKKLSPL